MQYEINLKSYSTHASREHSMPSATCAVSLFPAMHVIQPWPLQPCALNSHANYSSVWYSHVHYSHAWGGMHGGGIAMHGGSTAMHGGRLALQASPWRGGGVAAWTIMTSPFLSRCLALCLPAVPPSFPMSRLGFSVTRSVPFCAWETFYLSQVPNDEIMSQ